MRCNFLKHTFKLIIFGTHNLHTFTHKTLARLLDTASKFVFFSVSGLKDKVDKKSKPTWKLKHADSILESCEHFSQISSKSIIIISSYSVSKLVRFFGHSVFAINHLFILKIWRLAFCLSSLMVLADFVSSANNLILSPRTKSGKSLIYRKNKSGPSTDPWGMPQETGNSLQLGLCFLWVLVTWIKEICMYAYITTTTKTTTTTNTTTTMIAGPMITTFD